MVIVGANQKEIDDALDFANEVFGGNLWLDHGRQHGSLILKSKEHGQPGAMLSPSGKKVKIACWHAWGVFMDALPDGTIFKSVEFVGYETDGRPKYAMRTHKPGDPWQDWERGTNKNPVWQSDLCQCEKDGTQSLKWRAFLVRMNRKTMALHSDEDL